MSHDTNHSRARVSSAEITLIRAQRLRLALVNAIVLLMIWSILSVFVYILVVNQTSSTLDQRLVTYAERLRETFIHFPLSEPGYEERLSTPPKVGQTTFVPYLHELNEIAGSDHAFQWAVWRAKDWKLLSNGDVTPPLESALLIDAKKSDVKGFFNLHVGGQTYRCMQITSHHTGLVIQIFEDVSAQREVFQRLLIILLFGGVAAAILSILGGYSLGLWTLRPLMAARRREREFTADLSHELRTPLTVMATNLELLLRHVDEPLAQHLPWIEGIYRETKRMTRMTEEILDMARLESGGFVELVDIDVSELADEVFALYEPVAVEKGLALTVSLEEAVHCMGDRTRLRQILFILLDNAIKYTDQGTIVLQTQVRGNFAEIIVRDTGIGIRSEILPRVTERFVRGEPSRQRTTSSGLGLSIASRIVEAHQGRLILKSTPGSGTEVRVRLPKGSAYA
ncbi:sensor histidine kinase [Ferroacidibacillus organovorans]|uniref:sensor histidine kinase n=1 Tax=Ferroacidibacillus organovorans TaxID=1765683 RepID=UPI0007A8A8AF|nr:HAMP domain-containing sensor histidine kinase [Ferroacidibacillus organovorans]KYP80350.1 hypothetical protein AYJ22_11545 [Ferroacidibacillus organovorans]